MNGLDQLPVLVTGAAGGIGAAVVARLVAEGARVAALDLAAPDLPGVAYAGAVDVTDEDSVAAAVAASTAALGDLAGVVAVAGIHVTGPTHELSLADFRRTLDVSAVGTFLTLRATLPTLVARGDGRIVTFGSTAAVCAAPGLSAYAAAKGAVLQLTRSVAVEYAGSGVRANCLCPGGTATPLLAAINAERTSRDHFLEAHPIGRYARPDEVAAATAYLLSDDSSYVLGAAFMADGGFSAL